MCKPTFYKEILRRGGGRTGAQVAQIAAFLKDTARHWAKVDDETLIWERACAPGDLLDEETGSRAAHSAASNRKAEKGYGRWVSLGLRPGGSRASSC